LVIGKEQQVRSYRAADRLALMTEYKEIIVALIAVFGAVIPYLLQKNKELNLKIAEQKLRTFASFSDNVIISWVAASDADREGFSCASLTQTADG
jgi:hypothetical protein